MLAVSPDGRAFVYNAAGGLHLRRLSEAEAHIIPGTEAALANPFFSPTGDDVAFFQNGRLVRVAIAGGPVVEMASGVTNILGGHWAPDGTVFFGQGAGIMRVRAAGGTPELVVKGSDGETLGSPQLLPGGDAVLFTRYIGPDEVETVVESLSTHVRTRLVAGAADARYVPSGHLLYLWNNSVFAAPFDVERLEVREGVSVLPLVSRSVGGAFAQFAVADNGTLVFTTTNDGFSQGSQQLTWFSPRGQALGTLGQPAPILNFDLAADGRVVTERVQDGGRALWMADAAREWPLVPADFLDGGYLSDPTFSPAGDRVAFSTGVANSQERVGHPINRIYSVPSDGGVPAPLFGKGDRAIGWLEDWSPDGTRLLMLRNAVGVVATLGRDAEPDDVMFDRSPRLDELQFSPNGQWIAYHADRAAGGLNVYVVPYPPTGQVYKVSDSSGGSQPKWRQDGRVLFYLAPDGTLMSVPIESAPAFRAGRPEALFKTGLAVTPGFDQYAVASSGQRFLVRMPVKGDDLSPASVEVVLNWFEELKRLVPVN